MVDLGDEKLREFGRTGRENNWRIYQSY